MMIARFLLITILFPSAVLRAQTSTATIEGDVRDSTGAAIPGCMVRIVHAEAGTSHHTTASNAGHYFIPFLLPGTYSISAEHTGFQRFQQEGIKLDVQQVLTFDIRLNVGDVASTVEVIGTPAALATATSVVGANMERRSIEDLPLNGRVGLGLSFLVPGVIPAEGAAGSSIGVVNASPYPHSFTPWIAGSRNATSEVLMDGIPLGIPNVNGGTMTMGVSGPTVDAVQEFTVLTNALPAEYGRTGGGVINTASRQGTNRLHGTAHEYVRNAELDANFFFSNRAAQPRPSFQRNHYGGTLGGPVYVPQAYDGRNRTFFFFDLDRTQARVPNVFTTTVPLAAWKSGDFSDLRATNGTATAIYDPLTVKQDGTGTYVRDPFPGNRIPVERMDPVAVNVMKFYPAPNSAPTNPYSQANNWTRAGKDGADALDIGTRLDHNITERWRTFARLTRGTNTINPENFFDNPATPMGRGTQTFVRTSFGWDHTYTLNPSTVLNLRYGMARMDLRIRAFGAGFKPTELGLPQYMDTESSKNVLRFPRFDVQGITSLASGTGNQFVPTTHNALASVTKILGRHTLKTGAEYRKLFLNHWAETAAAGTYSFTTLWTQRGPTTASGGNGLASLLAGLPATASQTNTAFLAIASSYYAGYLQDDMRVGRRLTLNIGIRYDVDVPKTERFNQFSWLDITAPSPIAGRVAGYPNLTGAMQFAGSGNRQQAPTDFNNISPRFGFALRIDDKTSFRGAYALLYGPSLLQAGNKGTEGFRTSTAMTVSLDDRVPLNYLRNPFPYGFNAALGAKPGPDSGPATNLGLAVGESWFPANDSPTIQQWNATLQRQLPADFLVEIGYVANKGNHLCDGETVNYDQLPASYLSLREHLNDLVANPFAAVITNPNSTLSRPTVQARQLLSPYPQYSAVNLAAASFGNSIYHSMVLRVERRFAKGIGLRIAYTGGKLIDDSGFASTLNAGGMTTRQDVYNRSLDRSVSGQDVSSRLVISSTVELPFGRGHALLNNAPRIWNAIIGGWQTNAIVTLQSGLPILITQTLNQTGLGNAAQRPNNNGNSAELPARSKNEELSRWFNPAVFSVAPAFTFGTAGRTLPDVRQPGKRNFDLSLFKSFRVAERVNATFRAEAFNAFNTAQFAAANAQIGNSNVGVISATAVDPRQIQLALKLSF